MPLNFYNTLKCQYSALVNIIRLRIFLSVYLVHYNSKVVLLSLACLVVFCQQALCMGELLVHFR